MKSKSQKANIREMLRAESLGDTKLPWGDFKRKLSDEFLAAEVPTLNIAPPPRARKYYRWLVPAFAMSLVIGGLFIWRLDSEMSGNTRIAGTVFPRGAQKREFKKGDIFKSERREIRFLEGGAEITRDGEKIRIETTALTADFRLKQKVDMQIRHPLVTVIITGTEFIFAATPKGGTIRLSEGSLVIEHHGASEKKILLGAPAEFAFTASRHSVAPLKAGVSQEKILYRYDLVNGETFFAYQVKVGAENHRVHLLGGSEQTIPVENILHVVAAENP